MLLTIPRELRDDVYAYLMLPEHVYTSSPKSEPRAFAVTQKETYTDTRIYLPGRPPSNILASCKQLREEMLELAAHYMDSAKPSPLPEVATTEDDTGNETIHDTGAAFEDAEERARDNGCLRVTMDILRCIRGNTGTYVQCKRDAPSPIFMSMLPLLSRARKVKFTVWASWQWWSVKEVPRARTSRFKLGQRYKRTNFDQTEEPRERESVDDQDDAATSPKPPTPDPLSVAMRTILQHLPSVEEVFVDVLMLPTEWANWDLPDNKWEGVQGWLDDYDVLPNGRQSRRLYKRLIVCAPTMKAHAAILYHRQATWGPKSQDGTCAIHISEGEGTLDDFLFASSEPTFKRTYDITQRNVKTC